MEGTPKLKKELTILLLLFSIVLKAQDKSEKSNHFQLQIGHEQIKEENLHGKVHSGLLYGVGFEHQARKKYVSKVGIKLQYASLKTTYEDVAKSPNIQLSLNYAFLFQIYKTAKLTIDIGPQVKAHYSLNMYPNWDDSHLYWADQFNLEVYAQAHYQIKENSALAMSISFPFFSVFSRPLRERQYKIDQISLGGILGAMHSNIEVGTVNRVFNLIIELEYKFKISKKLEQALFYNFNYARVESINGNPYQMLQNNLGIKLYF